MKKYKIAVIEDDKILSKVLNDSLTDEGFDVTPALDGKEGLNLLMSEDFDFILLNMLLPGIDGNVILKRLREGERNKDVPVIILTIADDIERVAEAMEGGVYTYLIKDRTKVEDLIKIIKERLDSVDSKE